VALRDRNGNVEFPRRWSRSLAEFVGRPVAPFGGCDAAPGSGGGILGRFAALLGFLSASLGLLVALLGLVAAQIGSVTGLSGSVAPVLVLGPVAGIPGWAPKLLVGGGRAKLRGRNVAAVRRWRRFARNGRWPRSGWRLARRRPPPLTAPRRPDHRI
jgi:hypothetical protein